MRNDALYNVKDSRLYPIVVLEKILSHQLRHSLVGVTLAIIVLLGVVIGSMYVIMAFTEPSQELKDFLKVLFPKLVGGAFLLLSLWFVVYMLEAFFRSYYFKERELKISAAKGLHEEDMLSYQVLQILTKVRKRDITKAFLESKMGSRILLRCGVSSQDTQSFIRDRKIAIYEFPVPEGDALYILTDLAEYVFDSDEYFEDFLFHLGVNKKHFIGAANWVVSDNERAKDRERWWTEENLDKHGGLGADWAYGQAFTLNRFGSEVSSHGGKDTYAFATTSNRVQIDQLKDILSRTRESNAVLVGEQGGGKMSLLYGFAKELYEGNVPKVLEKKKIVLLNSELIISSSTNKIDFEMNTMKILDDAVSAGNIILAFDNFPAFLISARTLGSDVVRIMDPYFDSEHIQIIAMSDPENFHQHIEMNPDLMRRFEKIMVEQPEENEAVYILEQVAADLEKQNRVIFTYRSLLETVAGVYNYFSNPIMPDKAIDILVELPARNVRKKKVFIDKSDVLELIHEKTNIPVGAVDDAEREKLLHLEEILHERVIGQDHAIKAISNAIRRSRAGVRSMNRPIGSFLFIGSTGVGKTETAKALAEAFFGSADTMSRIDMSEYKGVAALERMIGSAVTGTVGTLTKIIKEHPYGVVLLDEFEKSTTEVHDLFLQILDEGHFSDMRGKKVNCKNIIFIATSNAGSQLIYDLIQNGTPKEEAQKQVVDTIISDGIFRPEFLNRFDDVILFHPLELPHIEQIAGIMLNGLKKRIKAKGIILEYDEALVRYVAKQGVDPVFGARPMNRYIQDHVEQIIADKMIQGELYEGATFRLLPEHLGEGDVDVKPDTATG